MDKLDILELDVDEATHVEGIVELRNAMREHDSPWLLPSTAGTVAAWMRHGWDLEPGRHFGGFVGDRLVVAGMVNTSEWDNLDLAWLGLSVHPEARGRGHGRSMADHVERVALEMGRPKVGADAFDGSAGVDFVVRRGYRHASTAVNRRQHLEEISLEKVQGLYDEATVAASAYELVRIVGRTPEELLEDVAVMSAAINDAPLDDLEMEDEVYPPQRIRDYETAVERRGERLYRLLVRHRESGQLAGHTVVAVEEDRPEIGHQHDTSVVRGHRGHRLGLLLKAGMNLWLSETEPQLRTVDTWNAESNDHMIAVNEALGYRPMGRELQFQRTLQVSSGPVA